MTKLRKKKEIKQAIQAIKEAFVKEKSIYLKKIGIIILIENCSSGEKNIKQRRKLIIGIEPIFFDYKTKTLSN